MTEEEKIDYLDIHKQTYKAHELTKYEDNLRAFFDKYPHLIKYPNVTSARNKTDREERSARYHQSLKNQERQRDAIEASYRYNNPKSKNNIRTKKDD